ncbi:MAG: TatD family hydrolase [Phycisphaerae bacterium]
MLIDSHCHLTSPELHSQVDAVVRRAADAGVKRLLTVTTDPADARDGLALVQRFDAVSVIAGIHPHEAGKCGDEHLAELSALQHGESLAPELARRIVAVGETGLDFHYDFATPQRQEQVFRRQLELAVAVGRPVVIHARKAEDRCCDVLADYPALVGRVVFHCFSGDLPMARRILDMGLFLSFTGVITFRNADALREVVRFAPHERVLLETDAPYLSPEPMRKIRPNEPALLVHTAQRMADIRGESLKSTAEAASQATQRFFGLTDAAAARA